MVFVGLGWLFGRWGIAVVGFDVDTELVQGLATITLMLILYTDASRINLRLLWREHDLPLRLLGIGLPLTFVAGTLVAAFMITGITVWESALVAIILAPTDAALGQAVVTSPKLPVRIRQALNVESGLNDGLALPAVLLFLSISMGVYDRAVTEWIEFALRQVLLGPLIGCLLGYVGGKLVMWGKRSAWMNHTFQGLATLGLALLVYAAAELVEGNGFIAVFFAGLMLGNTAQPICQSLFEFAEAEGQFLALLVFSIFGAIMVPEHLEHFQWQHLLYAIASLTLIRMVPVAISMSGAGLKWVTVIFLGWFGPRGIASILYAYLLLEGSQIPGMEQILSIVMTTVLLSVVAHGITAYPASIWYGKYAGRAHPTAAEHRDVQEMPVRIPVVSIRAHRQPPRGH